MTTKSQAAETSLSPDPAGGMDDAEMAEFMDSFRAPEIGGEGDLEHDVLTPEQADQVPEVEAPDPIDKAAFWIVFKAGFAIPSGFFPDFAPLAIQPHEEPTARTASDAIHDILSIYYPDALKPQSQLLTLLLAAGPFLIMKVAVVREILKARKAVVIEQRQPANRNEAPTGGGAGPQAAQGGGYRSPSAWMDQEGAAA